MHHSVVLKPRARHSVIEPLESRIAPAKLFAVTAANHLISFDSATPGTIDSDVAITGLGATELIDGADIRPATGQLYGLGITDNGATRTGQIYTIDATTGAATAVGAPFSATLSDTDLWGFDFNPTVDRIRIVDGLNGTSLRVNPGTGALVLADTNLTAGSLIDGVAYDRIAGGTTLTTLFGLDHSNNNLVRIGGVDGTPSPNGGLVTNIGALGIVPTDAFNFDIEAITGVARASAIVGGNTQLFTINLTTGAATAVGNIGTGATPISAMTSASAALAVVGTAASDTLLFTKNGYSLNGGALVPLTGITSFSFLGLAGDDVVTVDFVNGDPGISGAFTFIGGGDAGDKLAIANTNTQTAVWNPSNTVAGSGSITAGTGVAYAYSGVSSGLEVSKLSALTLRTGAGVDSFTLASAAAGIGDLSGTSSGFAHKITYTTTTSLNIDLGTNDAGTEADTLTVSALDGTGMQNLAVTTGPGNDQLNLNVTSLALPLAGGAFGYDGGVGTGDIVSATADVNMTLSDTSLAFAGAGSVNLTNVEVANLTGGAGNNSLTVTNWSGTGTYNGAGGTNSATLTAGNDNFTVSASRAGTGSGINFTSIDSVDGSGGGNTLNNTSGSVFAAATNTVSGIVTTNFQTISTPLLSLTAGGDTFTVTGNGTGTFGAINFTGLTAVDALGGGDTINLTAGADSITVAGTNAVTVATINFTNVETVDALGGTDLVVLPGGPDAITVTGNNAFTIPVSNLAFANVESVDGTAGVNSITLTAGNDAFTITGIRAGSGFGMTFASFDNVDGGAGVNSLTNSSGAAFAAATNSSANVTVTNFTNVSTPGLTLTNNADAFSATAAGAGTFAGVNYTGLVNVDGLLGTDTITLTAGDDAIQVNGTNAAATSTIAFANIEVIAAAGGADTVTLTAGNDTIAVDAANAATVAGIAFTAIENLDGAGGTDSVTLLAANDAIQANTTNAATVSGIAFTNIEAINGAGGTNAVTLTAGNDTFTITDIRIGNGGGINYTDIDSVDGAAGSNTLINSTALIYSAATNSVAGVTAANFQTVNTAALSLTAGNDSFTVSGAGTGTFAGVTYTGLTSVDALAPASPTLPGDTLINNSGQAYSAATNSVAGITAVNFETVNTPALSLTVDPDTFTVTGPNTATFAGVTYTGLTSVDALASSDTIVASQDADFILSDSSLVIGGINLGITSFEIANLTGGAGANSFTVSGWSGAGTLDGLTGSDTIIAINDVNFTLTDTSLERTGLGTLTLAGIEVANLTGGAGANSFTVSGWSGTGTLDGLTGSDTIIATNDVNFTLTDTSLERTGLGTLTLAGIEVANLTGGAGANSFTVSGWSGTGTLDGLADSDTIIAINDVNFTLTDTSLARTGRGTLTLAGIEVANLTGGASANSFTVSGWSGTGTLDGLTGSDTLIATNDVNFTLTDTSLERTGLGTLTLAGIEVANLTGGAGANSFTVSGWSGTGTLDGLADSDTLIAINDVNFTLTDTSLERTGLGTLTLAGIEVANLTGGAGANSFTVSGWSGTGTLDGMTGSDTLIATNDVNFTLTDTSLARTGLGTLTLARIEVANLTGGAGANSFTVSGWSGTGTLDGMTGSDTLIATNDVNFTLTDTSLARTGRGTLTLAGIEVANLTGGAGANSFTVSGWSGTGTLDGMTGSDTLIAINDVNFTLTDTSLARTGRGTLTLAGIEVANLTGGAGANSFTVSGWSGTGTLDGMTGSDTLIAINDVNFTLTDTSLARTALGTLTLAGIEVANLTGGAGANSFTVSGWTGTGTLAGAGGSEDTVVAVNDVNFVLADGSLARTGRGTMLLTGIEVANLTGGAGNNSFTVSDWTSGHRGTITGGGGSDTIFATKRKDFLLKNKRLYTSIDGMNLALNGIASANLTGGNNRNVFDAGAYTGTLTVKALKGHDVLIGGRGTNNLDGGAGDDLYVLTGTADLLTDVKGGFDLIDYSRSKNGVRVNLGKTGIQNVNGASTLSLSGSFEYLSGSNQDDNLIGSVKDNVIFGGGGNDLIKADPVTGLTGTNYLIGGDGIDTIVPGQGVDFIQDDGERPFVKIPSVSIPQTLARALASVRASHQTAIPESLLKMMVR